MTYLYLFSEGDTVHTLILSGRTAPRSAASSSRTTQLPPSPLRFWGAQDCTHEGEPLGLWLSLQGCCPAKETRGRGGTAAGYISGPGVTSNSASKQEKHLGSLLSQRVLRDDSTPARSVLGRVCLTAKCHSVGVCPGSLQGASYPSLPDADAHAWLRGDTGCRGSYASSGTGTYRIGAYQARGDPLLQSTERIKLPPHR